MSCLISLLDVGKDGSDDDEHDFLTLDGLLGYEALR